MKGMNLSECAHIVNLLPPVNTTGGVTSVYFNMANYAHASIIVQIGVSAAAPTAVTVNAATSAAATTTAVIPFAYYSCSTTATSDTLGVRTAATTTGFTPGAVDNIYYTIEIDSDELLAAGNGYNYIGVTQGNTTNSCIESMVAILTGPRFAQGSGIQATVLT